MCGALAVLLWVGGAVAQEDEPTSVISFLVVRDYNGKPIRNANVIVHPVEKNGKQGKGGIELKTDLDGKTSFDGIPYGTVRVQVLAEGFQTYGDDYAISQPKTAITIKLKRPQKQYSIYEDHPSQKDGQAPKDEKSQPDAKKPQ